MTIAAASTLDRVSFSPFSPFPPVFPLALPPYIPPKARLAARELVARAKREAEAMEDQFGAGCLVPLPPVGVGYGGEERRRAGRPEGIREIPEAARPRRVEVQMRVGEIARSLIYGDRLPWWVTTSSQA